MVRTYYLLYDVPCLLMKVTSIGIEKSIETAVSMKKYSVLYRNRYSRYRPPLVKTWVIKDFLRTIWVNIDRIFVGKLGENCQSSLVFCGYDDWRSDKAENYTRRGTVPQRVIN